MHTEVQLVTILKNTVLKYSWSLFIFKKHQKQKFTVWIVWMWIFLNTWNISIYFLCFFIFPKIGTFKNKIDIEFMYKKDKTIKEVALYNDELREIRKYLVNILIFLFWIYLNSIYYITSKMFYLWYIIWRAKVQYNRCIII